MYTGDSNVNVVAVEPSDDKLTELGFNVTTENGITV
tara:strand:- start:412 stop:519 length:108 start_codon:yes stop_codon:yes gene_type:complete